MEDSAGDWCVETNPFCIEVYRLVLPCDEGCEENFLPQQPYFLSRKKRSVNVFPFESMFLYGVGPSLSDSLCSSHSIVQLATSDTHFFSFLIFVGYMSIFGATETPV